MGKGPGRPAPHQLARAVSLLGTADEGELLQPVPELLASVELAPDEGQRPQPEDPERSGERRTCSPSWASHACQGARAARAVTSPLTVQRNGQARPGSARGPGGPTPWWAHCWIQQGRDRDGPPSGSRGVLTAVNWELTLTSSQSSNPGHTQSRLPRWRPGSGGHEPPRHPTPFLATALAKGLWAGPTPHKEEE